RFAFQIFVQQSQIKPDNIADVEKLLTNAEYEAGL
ncbi:hypothetical protein NES66_003907, partial [Acinetobacter baumannii]